MNHMKTSGKSVLIRRIRGFRVNNLEVPVPQSLETTMNNVGFMEQLLFYCVLLLYSSAWTSGNIYSPL